ncbi:right-handed parallel beta-helix repeat-containing protein [Staphylococcus gallinarum]|uniref:peptidase G2 autoproteolytic cleavage domain-containing protein n=2 Tax=Staphylococcus gallinarum TaxID=1293 RepID=UPI000D1F5D70|nr:peptidase G2 autoproteolytic cleavage domain-containing protein [Staphylococcus gallinarum]MCQ9288718.1 right-handed parallel beta-helix repeat-containing protein [Staphylococcus gallinarum]PTK92397.1 peptidase G2 [Staphylococcus gallinarum]RIL18280.1 peptidase G2 [Staphylococcus gallinarum]
MNLHLDYPIDIGREWRYKTIDNFKMLSNFYRDITSNMKYHRSEEKHAHHARQIDYENVNVETIIKYLFSRVDNLVIGHNGDVVNETKDSRVAVDGTPFNVLSDRLFYDFTRIEKKLDENYEKLNKKIERIVNVNDYGADPTGETNSDEAFKKALGSGNVHVHMTAGTYKIKNGIKLPSRTILSGEGKGVTVIKLADDAPRETLAVTNKDMDGTAEYIGTKGYSVDGNKARFDEKNVSDGIQFNHPAPSGGSLSSNVRFAGVKYGYIEDIKSIDALLHGFDITYASDDYYYGGDGARVNEELESKFIRINNCESVGHGDDGITTHHSRFINITNNVSHDPKNYHGNSNGIEIDDGSQNVMVSNNITFNNQCGIEIKAHETSSAASMVVVDGHISHKDNRSYVARHIGHHRAATDPKSKTAKDVTLSNIVSLFPYKNEVYPGWTPRALSISAYTNVSVNNFTAIGDGTFDSTSPAIAVQFMAENVQLNNINIRGFKNAIADIKIYGGANRPKKVTFSNINIHHSSNNIGIAGGAGVYDTKIIGANLIGNGTGNAIEMYNTTTTIIGVQHEGYTNGAVLFKQVYKDVPTAVRGGFMGGSTGSGALSRRSAVIATTGDSYAHSDRSWLLGAGMNSHAWGSRSGIINSLESKTTQGKYGQLILNSRGVLTEDNYVTVWGYNADSISKANTSVEIRSVSGNIKSKGTIQAGQNFGDYAEYFESQSGQEIPNGYIVTLDGRYIRKANSNDTPIGVISGTAGVVLGDQMFHHKDKYLKDEFGVTLTQLEKKEWHDDEGNWYEEEIEVPIPNPDFKENDEEEYLSRAERPEWNVVGLVGQVFTRIDNTVGVNDYIKPNKGIGTKDNNNGFYRVLEITTPFDTEKGYGVAVCLIK